ncbi:hypothetical protein PI124_g17959 [Phytophthora idaei]|nr:hypothetical protein PI125_g18479 [Phytophthora idaei]KAG3138111.1 hypothetical protein PI126_g17065 [Phytophthora idaei]KAG3237034.1 hypothetical protein PI124_g17959 [Phytophthora idaei]
MTSVLLIFDAKCDHMEDTSTGMELHLRSLDTPTLSQLGCHIRPTIQAAVEAVKMVLPLFIVGTAGTGAATGYGMYQVGTALALPSSVSEAPPKSASSLTAGGITAVAAYSVQGRILNRYLSHLLTYEVPKNVTKWSFRDFLSIAGPLIAPRVAMFSTSVALMGFVSTKMDLSRGKK